MKRMTTDNPQLNIERLLNTARAENNQAVLHLGDEVITLAEYVAKYAKETGCYVTPESVMDGDSCVECDCPVAILNILGIQAAENNARLKMIEKILGNDYDLDRLKELAEADREGRCVVLPVKVGDIVYTNISVLGDRYRNAERPYPVKVIFVGIGEGSVYFNVEYDNGRIFPFEGRNIGKTIFFTREEAESALKAMKESENDDRP